MNIYRSFMWINSIFFLVIFGLIIYSKLSQPSGGLLFLPPPTPPFPTAGLLTHTFQLLCCIPPLICTFSFGILNKIQPRNPNNEFFLASALITGGFLLNEIYRIHIIFLQSGIPKLTTISIYAVVILWYGFSFWQRIGQTPYFVLIISISLLFTAILVDSLHLSHYETASFLEGLPKLLSGLNLAIYFWWVCAEEVLHSFNGNQSKKKSKI